MVASFFVLLRGRAGIAKEGDSFTVWRILEPANFMGGEICELMAGSAGALRNVVNGADIRMMQRGSSPGLALESFERGFFGERILRQEFKRDLAFELGVLGTVNHAHSPRPSFSMIR